MKCWVCNRQARGFGHSDGRFKITDPRRYPLDWAFCSRRCQDAFHKLYSNWLSALDDPGKCKEAVMVDPSDIEVAAMRTCLKSFGEVAGRIGFTKPLGDYSEIEALRVINAIVTCYTEAMVEHHEATSFPPVRGMAPTPDPLVNPFADMKDDLPWETKP